MTNHLVAVPEPGSPEADRLIDLVINDEIRKWMAHHIATGEHVWNPETDVVMVRATTNPELVAEAEDAFARLLVDVIRSKESAS